MDKRKIDYDFIMKMRNELKMEKKLITKDQLTAESEVFKQLSSPIKRKEKVRLSSCTSY